MGSRELDVPASTLTPVHTAPSLEGSPSGVRAVFALVSRVQPTEWVVLAFMLFVIAHAGPLALQSLTPTVVGRAQLLFMILLLVAEVVLAIKARETTWHGSPAVKQRLLRWLPVALTPMAAAALVISQSSSEIPTSDAPRAFVIFSASAQALAVTSLPAAAWLWAWLELASGAPLTLLGVARATGSALIFAAREWVPIVVMISGYSWMGAVMDLKPVTSADAMLAAIDRTLCFGHDPIELLQAVISRPLSEYLAFSYSFYALLFPVTFGALAGLSNRRGFHEAGFAVSFGLFMSYISYTLIPAKGPVLSRSFDVPLDMYFVTSMKVALIDASRITWDCFPSMHTALSIVMLAALHRWVRWLFWLLLPIAGAIPFACLYLRYHYLIDVIAGAAFGVLLVFGSRRIIRQ